MKKRIYTLWRSFVTNVTSFTFITISCVSGLIWISKTYLYARHEWVFVTENCLCSRITMQNNHNPRIHKTPPFLSDNICGLVAKTNLCTDFCSVFMFNCVNNSPFNFSPLIGIGDSSDVLHYVLAGFCLSCSTFPCNKK